MFLCIGPSNSGKTALLESIRDAGHQKESSDKLLVTVPTIGTNLTFIPGKKRKSNICLRELGGVMAPIWPSYYQDCKGLLFVIDASNRQQIAVASMLLLKTLSNKNLGATPTLIILNKLDACQRECMATVRFLLRLEGILCHASQTITVVETSAKTGAGILQIRNWLKDI